MHNIDSSDRSVRAWRRAHRDEFIDTPLVLTGGKYTRGGVRHKLALQKSTCNKFLERGVLELYRNGAVKPQSIARAIGILFDVRQSDATLTEDEAKDAAKNAPEKLHNAYTGISWFNRFTLRELPFLKDCNVREWLPPSRSQLREWFLTDYPVIYRLESTGMIKPADGEFKARSSYNTVEPISLSKLVGHMAGRSYSDVLMTTESDPLLRELDFGYMHKKLLPRARELRVDNRSEYRLGEAARLLQIPQDRLIQACGQGTVGRTRQGYKDSWMLGIDVCIYGLQETTRERFELNDIANLFGVEPEIIRQLRLPRGPNGYHRESVVYPLYHIIAGRARSKLIRS